MINIFSHNIRSEAMKLYITDASLMVLMVFVLSVALPLNGDGAPGATAQWAGPAALAFAVTLGASLTSGAAGLYQPRAMASAGRAVQAASISLLLLIPVAFLLVQLLAAPGQHDQAWGAAMLGAIIALSLSRAGLGLRPHPPLCRVALLGGVPVGALGGSAVQQRHQPFEVTLQWLLAERLADALARGRLRAWRIWAVIIPCDMALPDALRGQCSAAGLKLFTQSEFGEVGLAQVSIEDLPPGWLTGAKAMHTGRVEAALRRGLDIVLALGLLIFTLPLLLVTMLAIRLDGPGPIFYRQERVGLGHRTFMLLKFRSMVVNAEAGGIPRWASPGDARVTRIGRFLRLSRIDEIPQALNVLRGDMSIVGPRPERPGFVETLRLSIPHYDARAVVKPGITGWAQVNYPYGASVEDARIKLAYDLYYVRRRSLFLDLLILLATVRVVLFQEGAR